MKETKNAPKESTSTKASRATQERAGAALKSKKDIRAEQIAERKAREAEQRAAIDKAVQALKDTLDARATHLGSMAAEIDKALAEIDRLTKKTDATKSAWSLTLRPITKIHDGESHNMILVQGLDRNAKVYIIPTADDECDVQVISRDAMSSNIERRMYTEAIVTASKDITVAVATRKAVAGLKFPAVWSIAKKQESERLEKLAGGMFPAFHK